MPTRVSRAIGSRIPKPLLGTALRAIYPRLEPELRHLDQIVPRGGTALDVGGWFGPWTQRLLRVADRVVTIEADPELAALLTRTFPGAQVVHAAASDEVGETTLWSPKGGAAVGLSSVEEPADRAGLSGARVPRIRLDDLELTDLRFVKMDIEGHELAALRGAEETIRRDLPVIAVELETRHHNVEPVCDLLRGWGYRGWVGETPLDEFDLAAHQAAHAHQLERSLPARVLRPGDRYVNTVVFRA